MGTIQDVFSSMSKLVQQQIDEIDELGFADKFKLATERFFSLIEDSKYLKDSPKMTVEDVEYLDGYFIFGHGTNSVVHFHIKECPGWKFGIWWTPFNDEKEESERVLIKGEFFCQYEDTIDKFKPSASTIAENIEIFIDDLNRAYGFIYTIKGIISFIIKQPHLAFCREYCGWDYNEEYHSPKEAEREFKKYLKQKELDETITANNDAIALEWVKVHVLPLYINAEIIDRGENWSPRYNIFVPFTENKELLDADRMGHFTWFSSIQKKWKKLINKLSNNALKKDVIWYAPFHDSVDLFDIEDDEEERE